MLHPEHRSRDGGDKAVRAGLTEAAVFDAGIRALLRKAEPGGVFCYTLLEAVGLGCHGGDHRERRGNRTMRLYGMKESGNCWKAATILALTGHAFEWVHTDANAGGTQTTAFLAVNPIGKVPALVLDDGTVLAESNAILLHFAEGTAWLPTPGLERTRVHEWLFFEQYSHEPFIAVARNLITWQHQKDSFPDRLAECARKGAHALDIMQRRLAEHDWLAGTAPTVADLALFAYTHRADEGEFDLARWPGVLAWVARMSDLPGITVLPRSDQVVRPGR